MLLGAFDELYHRLQTMAERYGKQQTSVWPVQTDYGEKDVFAIVSDKEPKKIKVLSYIMDDNFKLFNNKLDSFKKKKDFGKLPESLKTPAAYWLNLFSLVTSNLIEEKLKI